MANLRTNAELKDDALFRAGEPTDGSSDYDAKATQWLNRAYRALWMGGTEFDPGINEVWWWLKKEATIIVGPHYHETTVSVAQNSASGTLASGPTATLADRFFKVQDHGDVFLVSTHASGNTAIVLDTVYTGDTASAADFRAFKLEYSLASDCISVVSPMRAYQDGRHKITGMALEQMEDDWPLHQTAAGVPEHFAMVDETTVRFNRYAATGNYIRIDYDYLHRPSDLADNTASCVVPVQYRYLLADMTCFYVLTDKEDSRAEGIGLQARSGIRAMARENARRWGKMGEPGQIYPRQSAFRRSIGPLRTESGLIIG